MNDSFILKKGELEARLLAPESSEYARTRFSHSAFIADVVYKGVHFGQKEQIIPGKSTTGGAGLCCELICPDMEFTVPVGGRYLKPGIGYVERTGEVWKFGDNPAYTPFDTKVTADGETAEFYYETDDVNGYSCSERRRVSLEGNSVRLDVEFTNTGKNRIEMLEFCHNFLSPAGLGTGSRHRLYLPCVRNTALDSETAHMTDKGGMLTWQDGVQGFFKIYTDTVTPEGASWALEVDNTPLRVTETVSFSPVRLTVWGASHVISPEVFGDVSAAAGETVSWSRVWTFDA